MGNMLRCGGEIIRPAQDSQYRLRPCECGSNDVAYTRRIRLPYGVEWTAGCMTCGKTTRTWSVQHHAQIEWNGGKRPSWERD
jgi:hypothetical protein